MCLLGPDKAAGTYGPMQSFQRFDLLQSFTDSVNFKKTNTRSLRPTPTPNAQKAARLGAPARALVNARARLTAVGMTNYESLR